MSTAITASHLRRKRELLGQTVVVIGGSAGIGLETARRASAEGSKLILIDRNPESLQRTANEASVETAAIERKEQPPFRSPSLMIQESEYPMDERDSFSVIYEQQTHLAERELSSFIAAVTELYGLKQARLAAEDWLEESDLMDRPPRSEVRDWRSVTIAASARLASRVNVIATPVITAQSFDR